MGGGTWTTSAFADYSSSVGRSVSYTTLVDGTTTATLDSAMNYSSQDIFKATSLDAALNPYNVMRECCDNDEHPNTIPVMLVVDVTGSMGQAAVEVASGISTVMTRLYKEVPDVEFCIMAIGDLYCDRVPIQISQFESDIRIAEQLDKVYFEYGGGGNAYESYTAAWYMGARHTKLDCWNRGKRGIIITLGDEQLNPYLPVRALEKVTGDSLQDNVLTEDLYTEASEKFDIYHIDVDHRWNHDSEIEPSWLKYLDEDHFKSIKLNAVNDTIVEMIMHAIENNGGLTPVESAVQTNENGEIVW